MSFKTWRLLLLSPRFLSMLLLGFSSGLPLALTSSALEARYASADVSLQTIGYVTLVGLPYVFKFLWAPLMDRFTLPLLGRRRGWMLFCQMALMVAIAAMAVLRVETTPVMLAMLAVVVAFLSASQDIAIDAYRTDILEPEERGLGMSFFVGAYRAAMLVSGSFGLILADQMGWQVMYFSMALCMLIGIVASLTAQQPTGEAGAPKTLLEAFVEPFHDFFSRDSAVLLFMVVALYKFGDAMAAKLMTTFFVRGLHFSITEIGTVNKLGGFVAMLMGLFVGGLIMARVRLFTALMVFGVFQAISNLMFVWLAAVGHSFPLFVATVMVENFCSGMGNAAFLALIMSLCSKRYSAAQFALLTALAAVPREIIGPIVASIVTSSGWLALYQISFVASLPGLLLLYCMRNKWQAAPDSGLVAAELKN